MQVRRIEVALVNVPKGRRVTDPDWIVALGEDMRDNGQDTPIDVIEIEGGFELNTGLHRLLGMKHVGSADIFAKVWHRSEFANAAAVKLQEIAENFKRRPLSVLDRAFDIVQWRELFEGAAGAVKRGRKSNFLQSEKIADDELAAISTKFSGSFSAAAQKAFKLSQADIYRGLKIASIGQPLRERISLAAIADNRSELMALAAESHDRQARIVDLLLAEPAAAASIADAISIIDEVAPVAPAEAWARVSDKFCKLPETAKRRFFEEHWDLIEALIVERSQRKAA